MESHTEPGGAVERFPFWYPFENSDVLDAAAQLIPLEFTEVPRPLRRYIDAMGINRPTHLATGYEFHRCPEGIVHLVFESRIGSDGRCLEGDLVISGAHPELHPMPLGDRNEILVAQLQPGAGFAMTGVPGHHLSGRIVNAGDLWGKIGREIVQRIGEEKSSQARLEIFKQILIQRFQAFEKSDTFVIRAAHVLRHLDLRSPLHLIHERFGYSERQLRRKFNECIGFGPKKYARTIRLGEAIRRIAPNTDWSRLATDVGYADQPHFISEFRSMMQTTPQRFLETPLVPELLQWGIVARPIGGQAA